MSEIDNADSLYRRAIKAETECEVLEAHYELLEQKLSNHPDAEDIEIICSCLRDEMRREQVRNLFLEIERLRAELQGSDSGMTAALRYVAERQREACAKHYVDLLTREGIEYDGWVYVSLLEDAPLVTDEVKP